MPLLADEDYLYVYLPGTLLVKVFTRILALDSFQNWVIYLLMKCIYAYIFLRRLLVRPIYTYFCLGELPELVQILIFKKNGFRPIQLGGFSLLQSSASRSQFWLPELAFQKGSQQSPDFHVWSIFSLSAGYLAFGGCQQASKSGDSKHKIFTFGAYFGFRQDIWV